MTRNEYLPGIILVNRFDLCFILRLQLSWTVCKSALMTIGLIGEMSSTHYTKPYLLLAIILC